MKQRHKHADVIHAWAEGEEIEWRCNDADAWELVTSKYPSWLEEAEFRIKPKTGKKEGYMMVSTRGEGIRSPVFDSSMEVAEWRGSYACTDSLPYNKIVKVTWEE